jgi:hypothetical protein
MGIVFRIYSVFKSTYFLTHDEKTFIAHNGMKPTVIMTRTQLAAAAYGLSQGRRCSGLMGHDAAVAVTDPRQIRLILHQ